MLKAVMYITKLIVATLLALCAVSCQFKDSISSTSGSGNIVKQTRNINEKFDKIEVENAIDVEIEQSETTSVTVEADDNIIDKIRTNVDGNTLKIQFAIGSFKNGTKKVIVKLPEITGIQTSSASSVKGLNTFSGKKLELDASSASTINLTTEIEKIEVSTRSASTVKLSGMALELEADASSASNIQADKLEANIINADASSASTINVSPILELTAEASSGASVHYLTTPKNKLTINKKSGGSISKK